MKSLRKTITCLTMTAGFLISAAASAAPAYYSPNGVAIKGYDPVAYFSDSKAVKGNDEFVTEWMGAKWKFASKANLEAFKAEPTKFAPQYGGYCAYGTAKGHLAPTEPDAWAVIDGKLYLNYNERVRTTWKKDVVGYNAAADSQFTELLKGPTEE